MKNRQSIVLFLLAIAALVVAHVALDIRGSATAPIASRALVPSAHRATALVIARRGETPVHLAFDGRWRIASPFEAPADERVVLRLLDALAYSDALGEHTEADLLKLGREPSDYGLAEPSVAVRLTDGGAVTNEVLFGDRKPDGSGVYAAVSGRRRVTIVASNVLAAADCPARDLRRREIFSMACGEVASFDIVRGTGTFSRFLRDAEGWKMTMPRAASVSTKRVDALLGEILASAAADFVWPVGKTNELKAVSASLLAGYGLDTESATTLSVKGRDGRDRKISLGKAAGPGFVYALVFGGRAIATVDAALKEHLDAEGQALADSRLFPCEAETVRNISVTDGQETFLLARDAAGPWRLDAPLSAPADPAAVDALLARLLSLRAEDRVSEEGVLVSVSTNAEPVTVRREAVLAGGRLADLRSREIVKIAPEDVRRLTVTAEGARATSVVYDPERQTWNLESAERVGTVNLTVVNAILDALHPLVASSVVKARVTSAALATYGLDRPRYTIAVDLRREGAVRRNILIGERVKDGSYATLGAADAIFVISEEAVRTLISPVVVE